MWPVILIVFLWFYVICNAEDSPANPSEALGGGGGALQQSDHARTGSLGLSPCSCAWAVGSLGRQGGRVQPRSMKDESRTTACRAMDTEILDPSDPACLVLQLAFQHRLLARACAVDSAQIQQARESRGPVCCNALRPLVYDITAWQ